jgi:hypothetical protein
MSVSGVDSRIPGLKEASHALKEEKCSRTTMDLMLICHNPKTRKRRENGQAAGSKV